MKWHLQFDVAFALTVRRRFRIDSSTSLSHWQFDVAFALFWTGMNYPLLRTTPFTHYDVVPQIMHLSLLRKAWNTNNRPKSPEDKLYRERCRHTLLATWTFAWGLFCTFYMHFALEFKFWKFWIVKSRNSFPFWIENLLTIDRQVSVRSLLSLNTDGAVVEVLVTVHLMNCTWKREYKCLNVVVCTEHINLIQVTVIMPILKAC